MVMNLTRDQVGAKLNILAKKAKVKLLKFKRYSQHPDDEHLYTVLCEYITNDKNYVKYVTWLANIGTGTEGFGNGHYYESSLNIVSKEEILAKAEKDYNGRVFN